MTSIAGVPMRDIVPFLFALLGALVLITLVPETVLWLPRLFGYQG